MPAPLSVWIRNKVIGISKPILMLWLLTGVLGSVIFIKYDLSAWELKSTEWIEQAAYLVEGLSARQLESLSTSYYIAYPETRFTVVDGKTQTPAWSYPGSRLNREHSGKELRSTINRYTFSIKTSYRSILTNSRVFLYFYFGLSLSLILWIFLSSRRIGQSLRKEILRMHSTLSPEIEELRSTQVQIADASEKAKELELEAMIGRKTAQVAHDLRAPIGAFQALTESKHFGEEELELLRMATERLRTVSKKVLEDRKESLFQETTVSLQRILTLEANQMGKKFDFTIEIDPLKKLPEGDREECLSHLLNLAINALEAGSSGDRIHLFAKYSTAGELYVGVEDSGPGFPLRSIERFQRVGRIATNKPKGNGVALRNALLWAKERNGRLSIRNHEHRRGATVQLELPLSQAK